MADPRLTEILSLLDPEPGSSLWYGGATVLGSLRGISPELAGLEARATWSRYLGIHAPYRLLEVRGSPPAGGIGKTRIPAFARELARTAPGSRWRIMAAGSLAAALGARGSGCDNSRLRYEASR